MLKRLLLANSLILTPLQGATLADRDLGVLYPLQSDHHLTMSEDIFRAEWYRDIQLAFEKTSVGDALSIENEKNDWKLVSSRLVPCSPLGTFPDQELDNFCWPEVRQVWQPVLKNVKIKWNVFRPAYSDDRAIHVLYDVLVDEYQASELVDSIRNKLKDRRGLSSITDQERTEFLSLRDRAVAEFIERVTSLRGDGFSNEAYLGLGYRPETNDESQEKVFTQKLRAFFARLTPPENVKALTAFSLPEGRTPAATDEWIFLSFEGEEGSLKHVPIGVALTDDNGSQVSIGFHESASMSRDDPSFYNFLSGELGETLQKHVLLFQSDRQRLGPAIADRRQIMITNTSCGTCHKFNELRFNFHNFSYLEDLEPSIAPRTQMDIQLDLQWLKKFTSINRG